MESTYLDGTPHDHDGFELPMEQAMLVQDRAFLGELPVVTIFEGIENQFRDYMNIEDTENYVNIFYTQLDKSYEEIHEFDDEQYLMEIKDVLDQIHQQFVDLMQRLLSTYLTIGLTDLESGIVHRDNLEVIFRKLYEYFILNAKRNFKQVIAADMKSFAAGLPDDNNFYNTIYTEMEKYIPLFKEMTAEQFLEHCPDEDVQMMFSDGEITGNFLRKYSPKLYQNDEYMVEVVNYITMIIQVKKELADAT